MKQDEAAVTMEGEYETVPKLSNGAIWVTPNLDFKFPTLFNAK